MWETLYARTDERKEVGGREVENKRSTPFDCQIVSIACRKKERRESDTSREADEEKGGSKEKTNAAAEGRKL